MPWPTTWRFRVFLFSFSRRKFSPLARRVSFLRQNQTGLRNLCPYVCAMANKNQSLPDSFIAFYPLRRYNPPISLLILNIPLLFLLFYPTPFLPFLYRWVLNGADKRDEIYPISFLYRLFIILRSFLFVLFYFFFFFFYFFLFQEIDK